MSKTPEPQATLCLCMMVKNEAQVIERALLSVRPHIDYWVICDTGSTDETPDVIRRTMSGIEGELHYTNWVNFGHNREEVIGLAKDKADYILIMDADMRLNVKAPFKHKLTEDYYDIRYEGSLDYAQPMLISNRHHWRYEGVTHEYIYADTAQSLGLLPEITLTHFGDGGCRSDKFERDIRLLLKALEDQPGNCRYMFYLAQTYKDTEQWEQAIYWYQRRIEAGGWEEEQWYAMFQLAEMKRSLHHPWPEVLSAYLAAFDARPVRLEPIYAIVKHYRETGQYFQGYLYSSIVMKGVPYPNDDRLFIERGVYEHLLLLEHVACSLACNRLHETIEAANMLTWLAQVPVWVYNHAVEARGMAMQRMLRAPGPVANQNKIIVLVPFHNAGKFLDQCVQSLLEQDYPNFEVLFIDDASTDEGSEWDLPAGLNARIVRNARRRGALYNLHQAIMEYCNADDIVVCVDGDDWLSCHDALSFVNEQYEKYDCWLMYGQYKDSQGFPGLSAPFASKDDIKTLRKKWRTSHLKTFRAGLYHSIQQQDAEFTCMKDEKGKWLTSATDAAIMFPLVEMAGYERVLFNERALYVYNRSNPLSHHHTNLEKQLANWSWLSEQRPFAQITQYQSKKILTA
jgi:glycosyltransferase involved in cell wall biosynthesis